MRKPRQQPGGFSLIELLVVVVITAVAVTGVGFSLGATERAKLRSSCWMLASAVRYAYSSAVTRGQNVRMVLDFEARTIGLEFAEGRVVLNREDVTGEGLHRENEELFDPDAGPKGSGQLDFQMGGLLSTGNSLGAAGGGAMSMLGMGTGMGTGEEGNDMFAGMAEMASLPPSDPFLSAMYNGFSGGPIGYRRPSFKPIEGGRGEIRHLEGDVVFKQVFTPHSPTPQDSGKAYIYFFEGGLTEHAVIQLAGSDDRTYSVEIHPLTGRSIIHNEAVEPAEDLDELQEGEQ